MKLVIRACLLIVLLLVMRVADPAPNARSASANPDLVASTYFPPETTSISADGRYAVFDTKSDLYSNDVGLYDTTLKVFTPITSNGNAWDASISASGRYVVYNSESSPTGPGGLLLPYQRALFIYDRFTGTTQTLAVGGIYPRLSEGGRYVVFLSDSPQLIGPSGHLGVFVLDTQSGATDRIDVAGDGSEADAPATDYGDSCSPCIGPLSISRDGRYVAFQSSATNLVVPGTDGQIAVFVRDRISRSTTLIPGSTLGIGPEISADGAGVVFFRSGGSLYSWDRNSNSTVFLHTGGRHAISGDGRYVAFSDAYSNNGVLVTYCFHDPASGQQGIFMLDRLTGQTILINPPDPCWDGEDVAVSDDGRFVSYTGGAFPNFYNLYVHDLCPDTSCQTTVTPTPTATTTPTATATSTSPTAERLPKHVIVLIGGLTSEQDCTARQLEVRTIWIPDLLGGGSRGGRWIAVAAGLKPNENFDFAYYGYFSGGNTNPQCSSQPARVHYTKQDTCWSIDNSYAQIDPSNTVAGQGEMFGRFINEIVRSSAFDVKIDIFAHSQGATIAMYAFNRGLMDTSHINSIITFDGVDGGIPDTWTIPTSSYWIARGLNCFVSNSPYDSIADMKRGGPVVQCIMQMPGSGCSKRHVPLYAIDAVPGYAIPFDTPLGNSGIGLGKDVTYPGYGEYVPIGAPSHDTPFYSADQQLAPMTQFQPLDYNTCQSSPGCRWEDTVDQEKQRLRLLVGCAVSQALGNCEDALRSQNVNLLYPFEVKAVKVSSRPGSRNLTVIVQWPGSSVDVSLISPSGMAYHGNAKNATRVDSDTSTMWSVDNPEAGDWTAQLYGADLASIGELVSVAAVNPPDESNGETSTPTGTPTAQVTKTVTVTETTVATATNTPQSSLRTSTPVSTPVSTTTQLAVTAPRPATAVETSTPVSAALGAGRGPRVNEAGPAAFPNTGDGSRDSTRDYSVAILTLAAVGAGMLGAVAYRQRRLQGALGSRGCDCRDDQDDRDERPGRDE